MLKLKTEITRIAEAEATICPASGVKPSALTFQIWTAKVSAGLNGQMGELAEKGFQL